MRRGRGKVGWTRWASRVAYRRLARPVLFRIGRGDAETAHHRTLAALSRVSRSGPAAAVPWAASAVAHPSPAHGVRRRLPVRGGPGRRDGQGRRRAEGLARTGFRVRRGRHGHRARPAGQPAAAAVPAAPNPSRSSTGWASTTPGPAQLAGRLTRDRPDRCAAGHLARQVEGHPGRAAVGDYLTSLRAVYPYADYIAVNVSSPNTPGLRILQDERPLDELLGALTAEAGSLAWSSTGRPRRCRCW